MNASFGGETPDPTCWPRLAGYLARQFAAEPFASVLEAHRKIVAKMLARAPR